MTPLKYLVTINGRSLPETTDPAFEFMYVDIGSVGTGQLLEPPVLTTFAEAPSRARRLVRSGDTIVSTVRTYLRAVWPVPTDAEGLVVSTGFAVLEPKSGVEGRYLGWLAQSTPFVEEIVARSVGVSYPAVNASEIGNIRVALPALDEQRAIADYLDIETARIDALVAKKYKLLQAIRQRMGVVRHAVVTGAEHAKRRDAGWLGTVPEHWQVSPLRRLGTLYMGTTFPHEFQGVGAGDLPVVKVADLGRIDPYGVLQAPPNWIDHDAMVQLGARVLPPNCVLYARVGAAMLLNPRAMNPWACMVDDNVRGISFHGLLPEFGLEVMRLLDLGEIRNPGPVPSIGEEQVISIAVPVPPEDEQLHIVSRLRCEANRAARLTKTIEVQLGALREHRQALIAAATTREREVREVV